MLVGMKIERVDSFLLSYPMPAPIVLPYYGGERTIVKRDAMLIRVQAANGLVGHGPGPGSEELHQRIQTVIAPFLQGRLLAEPFREGCEANHVRKQDRDLPTFRFHATPPPRGNPAP